MATEATTASAEAGTTAEKPVMVVALDDGDHSHHALEWTLQHFFADVERCPSLFSLVVLHAKPLPSSVVGPGSPGVAEVWPFLESNLKNIAAGIVSRAKNLCNARAVKDVIVEVVEGDARVVILEAVERHRASLLVLGSHGYGAFKRFLLNFLRLCLGPDPTSLPLRQSITSAAPPTSKAVLGSVSDYCLHNAGCSVMIVKKPKASK